jgi:hypothetical protein
MKRIILFTAYCSLLAVASRAQYAPQAGVAGSTAVPATGAQIVDWANGCRVTRGWMDIANTSLGKTTSGDSSMAVGASDGTIVSLGDSGVAVLTFAKPIINGPGADFAVFENGFPNPNNPEEAFLELAFVEVSSDGINYTRFPATSLTQDTDQIAMAGTYANARLLNNLAGKYISHYGTPFDLQELAGTAGLDLNHITHVRLVDVVGDIGAHGSMDASGHKINDPYPTAIPTGGFDLDAVGVINQSATGVEMVAGREKLNIYPNPAADRLFVETEHAVSVSLTDVTGKVLGSYTVSGKTEIAVNALAKGLYYLIIRNANGTQWTERFSKI